MPKVTDKYVELKLHNIDEEEEGRKGLQGRSTGKRFSYTIYVDSSGTFSTTLKKEMVDFLESRGIGGLQVNRLGNKGHYTGDTIESIIRQVEAVAEKYHSYEVVEEKIQIAYFIDLAVTYVKDGEGVIHPNGVGVPDYTWVSGNITRDATHNGPSGYMFYAKPVSYRRVKYCDGSHKEFRERCTADLDEHGNFLLNVIAAPTSSSWESKKLQYLEYTPEAAKFFGDMYRSLFRLNEAIKDVINPESLQKLIDNGIKLLQ